MSLLSKVLNGLTGDEDNTADVTHPCQNCESNCSVCPDACGECKPYKEKLLNALYNVEHLEDFYNQYEVVAADAVAATLVCPYCGGTTTGPVCEYCGSKIGEDNGKIKVSSAAEIPNPIIEARDIIYARRKLVEKYADSSDNEGRGILGSLVSTLTGDDDDDSTSADGTMTESEIKSMAEQYGVSVRDYLEGLDVGTYLSRSAYEQQQKAQQYSSSGISAGAGLGAAGLGAAAGMLLGNNRSRSTQNDRPPMPPQEGRGGGQNGRPPMGGGQNGRTPVGNNQSGQQSGRMGGSSPRGGGSRGGNRTGASGTMGGGRMGGGSMGGGGRMGGGPMGGGGGRMGGTGGRPGGGRGR